MKKILLIGQLTDVSGYGNAARSYLYMLDKLHRDKEIKLSAYNYSFEDIAVVTEEEESMIGEYSLSQDLKNMRTEPSSGLLDEFISSSGYEVIFFLTNDWLSSGDLNLRRLLDESSKIYPCVVWETDQVPRLLSSSYSYHGDKISSLLCACDWNTEVFGMQTPYSTVTVPYFVSSKPQSKRERGALAPLLQKTIGDNKFVMSTVFQWSERKGADILLKSILLEFWEEEVFLILKTYKSLGAMEQDFFQKEIEKVKGDILSSNGTSSPCKVRFIVINDILNKRDMDDIYSASSAFITCTRGEGFGLPLAEAAINGNIVLSPSLGGHIDFLSKKENYFFDSTFEPAMLKNNIFSECMMSNWIESSVNSVRRNARCAFELWTADRPVYNKRAKISSEYTKRYLSLDRCTERMRHAILTKEPGE